MTLDEAHELLEVRVYISQGYNRNSAKLILAEVQREHGMEASDRLIIELNMPAVFGFESGQTFKSP